jgi:phosphosulfolactate phosphohydrolase-like enzyme
VATSTIATALHNGSKEIIPIDNVVDCIKWDLELNAITA